MLVNDAFMVKISVMTGFSLISYWDFCEIRYAKPHPEYGPEMKEMTPAGYFKILHEVKWLF